MRWIMLKNVRHNTLIQVSYFIVIGLPLIIEFSESLKTALKLNNFTLSVYYGGVAILIFYLLFSVFAPAEIKENKGLIEYIAKEKPVHMVILSSPPFMQRKRAYSDTEPVTNRHCGRN